MLSTVSRAFSTSVSTVSKARACCSNWSRSAWRRVRRATPAARSPRTYCALSDAATCSPRARSASAWGVRRPRRRSSTPRAAIARPWHVCASWRRRPPRERRPVQPAGAIVVRRHVPCRQPGRRQRRSCARQQGVRVRLSGTQRGGAVRSLRWRAWGCPHLMAACECACADYEGRPVEDLTKVKANDIMRKLSVPVEKTGRILVLEDAVRSLGEQLKRASASLKPTSTQES